MKVLITTSGTGSRLGEVTKHTNKALVRVGKKPAISYIIECYPKNTEFVITLGYKGDQVKDFLGHAYPGKKFTFVWVDKFEGEGTSLGYSMLCAKKKLQSPFIYHACDTIVEGFTAPKIKRNWVTGIRVKTGIEHYASFNFDKKTNRVTNFNPRGTKEYGLVHIGLVGIHDYKKFWDKLAGAYESNPNDSSLNDISGISPLIEEGIAFYAVPVPSWLDIGNPDALSHARKNISDRFDNLDKVDESLFFFGPFAIKFFSDPKKIANRVYRGKLLKKLAPKTLGVKNNFYKYEYVKGDRYSDVANAGDFAKFLDWSQKNVWKPVKEVNEKEFYALCRDFYEKKTLERIEKFYASHKVKDAPTVINGDKIPTLRELLSQVDFEELSKGTQTQFHGDYILENILKTKDGYRLLDWRQDFSGLLKGGDMYYDLAKLYHNLVVNHDNISKDKFVIEVAGKNIVCTIQRKKHLIQCEKAFDAYIVQRGLDLKKIKILRAIIWLNMSPLHHYPFSLFLYYHGKYHLWKALQEK